MKPFRLILGGDVFPSDKNLELFEHGDGEKLFDGKIIDLFKKADYSICNLEGVFTNSSIPIKKVDPIIKAPLKAIDGYNVLNISCFTLANNHVTDFGNIGFEQTVITLDSKNIRYFGAGLAGKIDTHIIIEAYEKKIGIYTVAETMFNTPTEKRIGVNIYDEYRVCKELELLKSICDYLIVIYHGGTEFFWYGSYLLRTRFHRMADSGADLITAQHTHCIGLQENYNGAYLLYGQGDFLFARKSSPYREYGILLEITVSEKISVKRHLIKHVDNRVEYDKHQDFSEYDERSERYIAGDVFESEYDSFSKEKMIQFLEAFRGKNIQDKVAKKFLSTAKYNKYLLGRYTEKQLLRIISGIEFEEYRESLLCGIKCSGINS